MSKNEKLQTKSLFTILFVLVIALIFFTVAIIYYARLRVELNPAPCQLAYCPRIWPQPRSYFYIVNGLPALLAGVMAVFDLSFIAVYSKKSTFGRNSTSIFFITNFIVFVGLALFYFR